VHHISAYPPDAPPKRLRTAGIPRRPAAVPGRSAPEHRIPQDPARRTPAPHAGYPDYDRMSVRRWCAHPAGQQLRKKNRKHTAYDVGCGHHNTVDNRRVSMWKPHGTAAGTATVPAGRHSNHRDSVATCAVAHPSVVAYAHTRRPICLMNSLRAGDGTAHAQRDEATVVTPSAEIRANQDDTHRDRIGRTDM
jgi:hypothetical protein